MPVTEILPAQNVRDPRNSCIGFRPPLSAAQQAMLKAARIGLSNEPRQLEESTDYKRVSTPPMSQRQLEDLAAQASFVLNQAGVETEVHTMALLGVNSQESIFAPFDRIMQQQ